MKPWDGWGFAAEACRTAARGCRDQGVAMPRALRPAWGRGEDGPPGTARGHIPAHISEISEEINN